MALRPTGTPLFGLAPGGVYRAAACYHPRGALLPHLFTLTTTRFQNAAVYFLWHFPWTRAPQALPGTLFAGARTFLPTQAIYTTPSGDCPADSSHHDNEAGSRCTVLLGICNGSAQPCDVYKLLFYAWNQPGAGQKQMFARAGRLNPDPAPPEPVCRAYVCSRSGDARLPQLQAAALQSAAAATVHHDIGRPTRRASGHRHGDAGIPS